MLSPFFTHELNGYSFSHSHYVRLPTQNICLFQVFFLKKSPARGALGSTFSVHDEKNFNHHFEVYHAVRQDKE